MTAIQCLDCDQDVPVQHYLAHQMACDCTLPRRTCLQCGEAVARDFRGHLAIHQVGNDLVAPDEVMEHFEEARP